MANGKAVLAGKVVDLMQKRPVWALVFMLMTFMLSGGATSYGISFLGQGAKLTSAVAELQRKDDYILSEINAERKARVEEITRLKEDGKLLSEDSIRLMIKEELQRFEDRLVKRLNGQ